MLAAALWAIGLAALLALFVGVPMLLAHALGKADAQADACTHPGQWLRIDGVHDARFGLSRMFGGSVTCMKCKTTFSVELRQDFAQRHGYAVHGGLLADAVMRDTMQQPAPVIPLIPLGKRA